MLTKCDIVQSQQTQYEVKYWEERLTLIMQTVQPEDILQERNNQAYKLHQQMKFKELVKKEAVSKNLGNIKTNAHIDMEGFKTVVLSSGVKVDFTDDFVEQLTLECLKYDVLQYSLKSEPMDKKRQTLLYAIGSALHLDISAAEMQEITQLLRREIYYKARRYAREDDGLCSAPTWLHEAAWRMRLLPAEHLPAPAATAPAASGFQLSARAARALLRRLRQTLSILHDPVLGVIWQDVSEASLQKFSVVLEAGDSLPQSRLLTEFEWRVVDLVLLYDDDLRHRVVTENSLEQVLQRAALEVTCDAALAHRVDERVSRVELARRWSRAYQQYISKGLRTSLLVLQRRWFELKRLARRRGGAGGGGGAGAALLARVARHAGLAAPPAWPDLVRKGMVLTDQDLLEAEIEGLVPSQGPTIEKTSAMNVKVEQYCYEQECGAEEARERFGGVEEQPACFIKQEPDTLDLKAIIERTESALFRFESDEESEPDDSSKQQTAPVAVSNDITRRTSTKQGWLAEKLKVEREEDVSGHRESHDADIDPKLLMDARVVVERFDIDVMLSKRSRVPPRELDIEEESSVDSGELWQPDSESEGEGLGDAEEARPVTLRDIDEVRRLTQFKLTAQVAPAPHAGHIKEDPTVDEHESDISVVTTNETPPVVVKVTDYCPLGLKNTRLRYGQGQSKRERQAAKRNHSKIQHPLTSSTKIRPKKMRQEDPAPEPPGPYNDLQEYLRQRNVNSRYFGPAPTALAPAVALDKASLPANAAMITRTLQSTKNLPQNKTNKSKSSSAFTGFRKIAPATDPSSQVTTTVSNAVSKVPRYKPTGYISMLVAPSESRQEATSAPFTTSTPPLVANNSTVVSTVTAHQSSEPAQTSPLLLPKLQVVNATVSTTAVSQNSTSTQLPSSMSNFVLDPGSTIMTTSAENQACTSIPLPTSTAAINSKKETMKNTPTVLKFKPTVAKSQVSIFRNFFKTTGKGKAKATPVKLLTTSAPLPVSNPMPLLQSETTTVTTVTTTAPNHHTTSARLSAPMSMVLIKPVQTTVDSTAANKASTPVQFPASIPPLVPISKEITVNTMNSYRNPTTAQSLTMPMLVLSPRDNAMTVTGTGYCSNAPQYPTLPPSSTTSAAATTVLSSNPNASTPGGLVLQTPPLLVNHNFTTTGTESSPVIKMLLTSPQLASWVMDQLTTNTNIPPWLMPKVDETKTSFCTDVTAVQKNEESCSKEVHDVDKDKQNDTSASKLRKLLEKSPEPFPSAASLIVSPSLVKSQPGAQCAILGNNLTMSAVDYVNSLNHKKLKVICKKESVPFWIVANDYLVLTDNPRFVVKGKPAFYTLAPPEEIALLTFELDGKESEPLDEPGGDAEGGAGGGAGRAGGAALAPSRMCVEGKLYQKLCTSPLRYAQVLGAVRDAATCRRLAARGHALLLYHARRHALAAMRSVRQLLRIIGDLESGEDVIEIDVPEEDERSGS